MATQVNGAVNESTSEDDKPTAKPKGLATFAIPVDCLDDKGKINRVPTNFDPMKFKPLTKDLFTSDDVNMDFRALNLTTRANKMLDTAKKLRDRAERTRRFGDEVTRKAAAKHIKLREQLAALEAELTLKGINLEDLD